MQQKFTGEDFSLLLSNEGELFLKYLFDRYYRELCQLSFRYVGRSDVAEDIVQEVFINIWNSRFTLNYVGLIKPCFIKSVINTSLNYINSKYGRIIFEELKLVISEKKIEENNLESKELEKLIEFAIAQLPVKCRAIFSMSRLSGLSHKEISENLNISVKTIEAQITIALRKIHNYLMKAGYFIFIFFLSK